MPAIALVQAGEHVGQRLGRSSAQQRERRHAAQRDLGQDAERADAEPGGREESAFDRVEQRTTSPVPVTRVDGLHEGGEAAVGGTGAVGAGGDRAGDGLRVDVAEVGHGQAVLGQPALSGVQRHAGLDRDQAGAGRRRPGRRGGAARAGLVVGDGDAGERVAAADRLDRASGRRRLLDERGDLVDGAGVRTSTATACWLPPQLRQRVRRSIVTVITALSSPTERTVAQNRECRVSPASRRCVSLVDPSNVPIITAEREWRRVSTPTVTTGPLRRVPVQGRSVARVQRMLDACAELVDEVGYEGLTTTLLAERAEVAIGSVYQFFPDKRAIVQALAMRNMDAYLQRLSARFADETFAHWWDARGRGDRRVHRTCTAACPGFRTLHFGDVVDLHLLDEERDNNAVIADRLAELLVEQFRLMDRPRLRFALEIAVETADALIKLAFRRDSDGDEAVLAEAKALIREYLHRHVDGLSQPEGVELSPGTHGPRPGTSGPASTVSPSTRCSSSTCSHSSPALAWRNHTRSPTRSVVGGRRRSAASAPRRRPRSPSSCSPAGSHGMRLPGRARPARRRSSRRRARSRCRGAGRRTTDSAKNAAGRGPPGAVGVEQRRPVQARSRR